MAVITLTTEWRSDDIYHGIIRGRLCSLCPDAPVIVNASGILPFDISNAAFIIRNTYYNYPKGSVHIICVHSESRDEARHFIIKARDHFFIGTDNGIFNLILNSDPDEIIKINPEGETNELEIFARAAAGLYSGIAPASLGEPVEGLTERMPLRATIDKDVIIGSIIFIDSYGNAISNITKEIFYRVFDKRRFRISIQSNQNYTEHISGRYGEVPVGELLARFNSLDLLEISINGADMSELLSIETGSSVRVDAIDSKAPSNRLF